jgi:hypothetical protein
VQDRCGRDSLQQVAVAKPQVSLPIFEECCDGHLVVASRDPAGDMPVVLDQPMLGTHPEVVLTVLDHRQYLLVHHLGRELRDDDALAVPHSKSVVRSDPHRTILHGKEAVHLEVGNAAGNGGDDPVLPCEDAGLAGANPQPAVGCLGHGDEQCCGAKR